MAAMENGLLIKLGEVSKAKWLQFCGFHTVSLFVSAKHPEVLRS
jgi:hypothetical protein